MFAVVVHFDIIPEKYAAFLPLMRENARKSLAQEPECHRFDVWTDPKRPNQIFLYEVYSNAAAFQTHLESAHFIAFDAAVGDMVADKTVTVWTESEV